YTSCVLIFFFFFSSRRRHTRFSRDWSSDVCSSDLLLRVVVETLDEIIEPALADGDGALALDPVAQLREVPRAVFREEHRMQAVRSEERRVGKECRSRWTA